MQNTIFPLNQTYLMFKSIQVEKVMSAMPSVLLLSLWQTKKTHDSTN